MATWQSVIFVQKFSCVSWATHGSYLSWAGSQCPCVSKAVRKYWSIHTKIVLPPFVSAALIFVFPFLLLPLKLDQPGWLSRSGVKPGWMEGGNVLDLVVAFPVPWSPRGIEARWRSECFCRLFSLLPSDFQITDEVSHCLDVQGLLMVVDGSR